MYYKAPFDDLSVTNGICPACVQRLKVADAQMVQVRAPRSKQDLLTESIATGVGIFLAFVLSALLQG